MDQVSDGGWTHTDWGDVRPPGFKRMVWPDLDEEATIESFITGDDALDHLQVTAMVGDWLFNDDHATRPWRCPFRKRMPVPDGYWVGCEHPERAWDNRAVCGPTCDRCKVLMLARCAADPDGWPVQVGQERMGAWGLGRNELGRTILTAAAEHGDPDAIGLLRDLLRREVTDVTLSNP